MPEGFTIHGYAGPRLRGAQLLAGLRRRLLRRRWRRPAARSSGRSRWPRRPTSSSTSTRRRRSCGDVAYVASYSGGLYALDPRDGSRALAARHRGRRRRHRRRRPPLLRGARATGCTPPTPTATSLWRQGLTEAGDLTHPMVVGHYLIFSGSRAGLFVVDRAHRRAAGDLQPGPAASAPPATLDPASAPPLRPVEQRLALRAEPDLIVGSRASRSRRAG